MWSYLPRSSVKKVRMLWKYNQFFRRVWTLLCAVTDLGFYNLEDKSI